MSVGVNSTICWLSAPTDIYAEELLLPFLLVGKV